VARELGPDGVLVLNVSGRGDKDVDQARRLLAATRSAPPKRARRAERRRAR
jgi:tryptophan synthase beta chain